MSDLVGNPEERFSHNEAQMLIVKLAVNRDYKAVDGLSQQHVFACMVYKIDSVYSTVTPMGMSK